MSADPTWWRGQVPPDDVRSVFARGWERPITGEVTRWPPAEAETIQGLTIRQFFRADVCDVELDVGAVNLSSAWSVFTRCHFTQRVRPVLNEFGVAAQGSFGNRPSLYRDCVFDRVRFKLLGGFSMGQARFEGCTFRNCRWEGHFAHDAHLVDCVFAGRMNGCVWFGHPLRDEGGRPDNLIVGNDFSATLFTDNVGWRGDFPVGRQRWPSGYTPPVSTF